jgi:hypothetical protein
MRQIFLNDDFEFKAGNFRIHDSPFGKTLRALLRLRSTLDLLGIADADGLLSLEHIQTLLIDQFGEQIKANEAKRYAGFLVSQIFQANGYEIAKQGERFPKPVVLFTTRTRFAKKEARTMLGDVSEPSSPTQFFIKTGAGGGIILNVTYQVVGPDIVQSW